MKKKKLDRTEEIFLTFLKINYSSLSSLALNQVLSCSKQANKKDSQQALAPL